MTRKTFAFIPVVSDSLSLPPTATRVLSGVPNDPQPHLEPRPNARQGHRPPTRRQPTPGRPRYRRQQQQRCRSERCLPAGDGSSRSVPILLSGNDEAPTGLPQPHLFGQPALRRQGANGPAGEAEGARQPPDPQSHAVFFTCKFSGSCMLGSPFHMMGIVFLLMYTPF